MTKILYIYGDEDYAAATFEDCGIEPEVVWQEAFDSKKHIKEYDIDGDEFTAEALEFDDIPEDFIDFVRDTVIDYDQSKHTNFYLVK